MRKFFIITLCIASSLAAEELIELKPFLVVAPNLQTLDERMEGEELREAKPLDLASILSAEMPTIALSRKSPLAGDIVLRGMTRDNILITVDNTKTFCACPNRMDPPAFHVSSQQIEAISIRTGPFSVQQGATTGGAVFVKTTAAQEGQNLRAYAYGGSFNYLAGGVSGSSSLFDNKANFQLGVYSQQGDVFEDGDGTLFTQLPGTNYQSAYIDGEAFKVFNLETKLSAKLSGGKVVTFNYALQDSTDVLYPGLKMDALTDTMNRGSIGLSMPLSLGIADSVSILLAASTVDHDMRDSYRTSSLMSPLTISRGYAMRTSSETTYLGLTVEAKKELDDGVINYGLDLMERKWDADNTIMMLENDMLPDVVARTAGFWSVLEKAASELKYEIGLRLDYAETRARDDISFVQNLHQTTTNDAEDILASSYVLFHYPLNEDTDLFFGLGHGERLPDPQERYLNLNRPNANPDWVGNPDLNPVSNTEVQFGGRYRKEKFSASVSFFHAWLHDLIYLSSIQTANTKATTYENIDARLYGFSCDASMQLSENIYFRTALAWQEGVKSDTMAGATDYLAEIPPLKAVFSVGWESRKVSLRASAQFQDDLRKIDTDLNEQPIAASWVFNLAAHWRFNDRLTFSAGVDNLFDETYAVANSHLRDPFSTSVIVNEPGRFFFLRLSADY